MATIGRVGGWRCGAWPTLAMRQMTALRSSAPSAFLSGVMESAISCGGAQWGGGREEGGGLGLAGLGEGGHRHGRERSVVRLPLV